MAADDTDEPIHFLMNWSRQKGWSRIYHSTSSAFPIAQVKLYSSTQKLLSTKEDVLKKKLVFMKKRLLPGLFRVIKFLEI